ncbi:MAG: MBL fold metallo-hydrolase [Chitinophagales bacterium]|nr:MAG: MBL fold metallo-hydrolase [Chitinophagales bacterium]
MEVVFLGTGTSGGVPMVGCYTGVCLSDNPKDKRLRSSVLLHVNGKTIVIDCGPDFRQQMLREQVRKIDAIVFTHSHKDHTGGLDDIRGFNYVLKKAIPLYMDAETEKAIRRQYDYIFGNSDYPGVPKVEIHNFGNEPFWVEGVRFIPIEALHYRMRVYAFRIGDFTYVTDANFIAPQEKEKIKGSRVLVLNALRKEPHISHFTLSQALELVDELKPEKAYLTHISHQLGYHEEVNRSLPAGVELAYDGLRITL